MREEAFKDVFVFTLGMRGGDPPEAARIVAKPKHPPIAHHQAPLKIHTVGAQGGSEK